MSKCSSELPASSRFERHLPLPNCSPSHVSASSIIDAEAARSALRVFSLLHQKERPNMEWREWAAAAVKRGQPRTIDTTACSSCLAGDLTPTSSAHPRLEHESFPRRERTLPRPDQTHLQTSSCAARTRLAPHDWHRDWFSCSRIERLSRESYLCHARETFPFGSAVSRHIHVSAAIGR